MVFGGRVVHCSADHGEFCLHLSRSRTLIVALCLGRRVCARLGLIAPGTAPVRRQDGRGLTWPLGR